jgi:photosystem II stability/assembly factor-like uncharacterized protein
MRNSHKINFGFIISSLLVMTSIYSCSATNSPLGNLVSVTILKSGTDKDLYSIHFIDQNKGFAVGDSLILLKTTNSGETWTHTFFEPDTFILEDRYLFDIDFFDDKKGSIAGSRMYETSDGGNTWTHNDFSTVSSLEFHQDNFGVASGLFAGQNSATPTLAVTSDAGETWKSIAPYFNRSYVCLGTTASFIDPLRGCIGLGGQESGLGSIYRTTNGGLTWDSLRNDSSGVDYLQCISTDIHALNAQGMILLSTDFGSSWVVQSPPVSSRLSSIYFSSQSTGYITGDNGTLLMTTDGGVKWNIIPTGTNEYLLNIHFPSPDIGFVVGTNGTVLKITLR